MKDAIVSLLEKPTGMKRDEILNLLEIPKDSSLGDYAFPCFILAKTLKKNPVEIARSLAAQIKSKDIEKVEAKGPYLNFFINRSFLAQEVIKKILKEKDKYGSSKIGKNKKIVIDLSAPNIAKPFGIGHLRSTIIGSSIANIANFQGYKTIKINYLGDWGTQFGKLITAYKKWGDKNKLKENAIRYLQELYVKVNQDDSLEQESRDWFRKLEEGDKEAVKLWKQFRELSLKEFDKIYKILGVKFDVISGESLYNKKMNTVIDMLKQKCLLKENEGAQIVDLEEYGLGVCLIKKSDGATLYATRDITAAIDRYNQYKFTKMVYEVGSEQTLHFKQIFKVLELAGFPWAKDCSHIAHGLYLDLDGKKFATRKGKTVFMEDILDETSSLAKKELKIRYPKMTERELEERAKAIALSAIIYGDLKNYRVNDIIFNIERFLSFEGDTGPYLLYSYARAKSILAKVKTSKTKNNKTSSINDSEKHLVSLLANFPEVVSEANKSYSPNLIANYTFQLSQNFNEFYHFHQVIGSENEAFRLMLVESFSIVLKNSLSLMGISVLEKM